MHVVCTSQITVICLLSLFLCLELSISSCSLQSLTEVTVDARGSLWCWTRCFPSPWQCAGAPDLASPQHWPLVLQGSVRMFLSRVLSLQASIPRSLAAQLRVCSQAFSLPKVMLLLLHRFLLEPVSIASTYLTRLALWTVAAFTLFPLSPHATDASSVQVARPTS